MKPCACRHFQRPPASADLGTTPICCHPDLGPGSGAFAGELGERILGWLGSREGWCPGVEPVTTSSQRSLF